MVELRPPRIVSLRVSTAKVAFGYNTTEHPGLRLGQEAFGNLSNVCAANNASGSNPGPGVKGAYSAGVSFSKETDVPD